MSNLNRLSENVGAIAGVGETDSGKLGYYAAGRWRIVDPDDPKRFLVRFANGTHVSAYHRNRVPQKYDLNVLVSRDHLGRPIIIGEDVSSNQNFHPANSAGSNVGWHIHPRGSGQEFIVDEWMLKHLRVTGSDQSLTVSISAGSYLYNRQLHWKNTGSLNLSAELPTEPIEIRWVIIGIDPVTDSFVFRSGDSFTPIGDNPELSNLELIDFVQLGYVPLAAVWLTSEDTTIPGNRVQDLRHHVGNFFWYLGDLLNVSSDSDYNDYVLTYENGIWGGRPTLTVNNTDVSNPPTDSELNTAFGVKKDGFAGLIDDEGLGTTVWLVVRKNNKWWYTQLNEAL